MPNNSRWKKDEKDILERFYPWIPSTEISEVLPIRTPRAIQAYANRLGLNKRPDVHAEINRTNVRKRYDRGDDGPQAA